MAIEPTIQDLHFDWAPSIETPVRARDRGRCSSARRLDSRAVVYPRDVPIAFVGDRGATLCDVDGNLYLDFSPTSAC